jgi:hypothetical protein
MEIVKCQERISAFLQHPPPSLSRAAAAAATSSSSLPSSTTPSPASTSGRKLPLSLRAARAAAALDSGSTSPARRQDRVEEKIEESKRARYRIVEGRRDDKVAAEEMKRGPLPPQVM